MSTGFIKIGHQVAWTLTVLALLVYSATAPVRPGEEGDLSIGADSCCCAGAPAWAESGGPCSCDCDEDVCGTATCSSMSRTVQPFLGAAWLFARPSAQWASVVVDGDQACSRSICPTVPPPITV